jgi:hypothetical protein
LGIGDGPVPTGVSLSGQIPYFIHRLTVLLSHVHLLLYRSSTQHATAVDPSPAFPSLHRHVLEHID